MLSPLLLIAAVTAAGAWAVPAQQYLKGGEAPVAPLDHSQGYEFDPLLHLPGISPYFDAVGFGLEHRAPKGCNVTAASYLVRHASIYANDDEYEEYIKPFLTKLNQTRSGWSGPLSFLSNWKSPILEDRLEDVTPSGINDSVQVGKHLLARYPHLVGATKAILADKKSRTYDTAKAFVRAFPQAEEIEVVRILKNQNGSLDSLTPHKSCPAFNKKPGKKEMDDFVRNYAPGVSVRLDSYAPFTLNNSDIMALQSLCGYESAILGTRSPICAVFTDAEWMAYEYAWDLKYAYMVGPLNKLSPYLGFPWLTAQTELFRQIHHDSNKTNNNDDDDKSNVQHRNDSESHGSLEGWPPGQRLFLSFTHREVPPFVATALGIFNSSSFATEQFPTTHINWVRAWKMADLIPFLGHVGLEKMHCDADYSGMEGDFVRVIANSAPRPIPRCQGGPGASCKWEEFKEIIKKGAEKYGDFHGVCNGDVEPE